ncbi:MAG TPA: inositol monophosphatase [Candidatus Saccharimonadales bacterium]|nr:inositol monophosphatase [Candidatus Saccharimonadales bacterium]
MTKTFLEVGLEAAKKAEAIIQYYASEKIRATLKKDQSPVTVADKEAEDIIIKIIKENFPDHGILGEETGKSITQSDFLWIIDPIDGTKNFMRKIPTYATQVALWHKNEIIMGISNAPAFDECITAEKGKGAYLNGEKIYVSQMKELQYAFMCFGGLTHFKKNNFVDNLFLLSDSVQGKRNFGDFWNYHLLAEGKVDIVIEMNVKIWDIAAISLIVEEAGGEITDVQGNPITQSTNSIIATNGILHKEVLNFFK